jgi:hypothetical protein
MRLAMEWCSPVKAKVLRIAAATRHRLAVDFLPRGERYVTTFTSRVCGLLRRSRASIFMRESML